MSKAMADGITLTTNEKLKEGVKEGVKLEENIQLSVPAKELIKQHAGLGWVLAAGVSPIYQILRRKAGFNLNAVLRNTWISAAGLGAPLGGGIGYFRVKTLSDSEVLRWYNANSKDRNLLQITDFAVIGGTLGSLIVPTLLLKRVRLPNGLLGGAAIGSTVGATVGIFK